MVHALHEDLQRLGAHYGQLLAEHGDSPAAAQWADRETQEERFRILAGVGDISQAKILDFGCGTGHLLAYLRRCHGFRGEYVGYDLNAAVIACARAKFPDARFACRDGLSEPLEEDFDYVFISGVFNNKIGDNAALIRTVLPNVFAHTRRALAFNALSCYVDRFDDGLYYAEPESLFRFCKENLSPLVTLRHDYCVRPGVVPYDFTLYVHRTPIAVRKALSPTSAGTAG